MPTVDYIGFVQGVAATAVPGVVHDFGMEPPGSLSTADLPAKFLRLPRTQRERFAFAVDGADMHGTGIMTVEVVIAFMPTVQGLPEDNFTETVRLVDAITKTFVKAETVPAMSWPEVNCRVTVFSVAGIDYWSILAEISARG